MSLRTAVVSAVFSVCLSGCITVVDGHERALFYSAREGMKPDPVQAGWYWHAPWNGYQKYDLRWTSHAEEIHIHSKDGLHMNITLVSVVRPEAKALYQLHTDVGPDFYEHIVRPAVFAAARDAAAQFNHLEIATQTHELETSVRASLEEHLKGKHLELGEVAVQHFDLPPEVETAANKKATANQVLAAKEVDVKIAETDARIEQEKRRGAAEVTGLERKLRAQQDLDAANLAAQIEEAKRKAELVKVKADAEALAVTAKAEADAVKLKAEAEKFRVAAASQNLSENYVRLRALEVLGTSLASGNQRIYVAPTGKNGLPMYMGPFMNPFGAGLTDFGSASNTKDDRPVQ